MKQNKILAMALAAIGATGGAANAANVGLTLTSVTSYSNNGSAPATLTGTVKSGWTYDTVAGTITAPGNYQDMYSVGIQVLMQHVIQGFVISTTGAPAAGTAYTCYEGTFGFFSSASICGNYNFGANFINQSTTSWGPGIAYSRTMGGDDGIPLTTHGGDQQNLSYYDGFSLIGSVGATLQVGNTDNNGGLPAATSGYSFQFDVTPPAADDGIIYVSPTVAKVIPVGKNDIGFTNPVTVTVTTPPTKGTINAISTPGAAGGMTITYTANIGESGADSFVYQMADATPFSDSALVSINIGPDTDSDGVPDNNDNCRTTANNDAGTVPNSAPAVLKSQLDTDGDGYGNICDGDVNNSNLTTAQDNTVLRNVLNQTYSMLTNAGKSDLNGSGLVTAQDNTILRNRLNTAPGPSGLGCAGTGTIQVPCSPAAQ